VIFKNLTPFDALAFTGTDTQDREYHVVALAVGYLLEKREGAWQARVLDDEPVPLCLADEHWGEPAGSSLARESDLVPYKPRCDVVVRGHSFAPCGQPATHWLARLRMTQAPRERLPEPEPPQPLNPVQGLTAAQRAEWARTLERHRREQAASDARPPRVVLDKALRVSGPSHYTRSALHGWRRGPVQVANAAPLRWELAFGGTCRVVKRSAAPEGAVADEVCFSNPVGRGWVHTGWERALARAGQEPPPSLPAPQITASGEDVPRTPLAFTHPPGEQDARAMRTIAQGYGWMPAGFSVVGKAWAPRLALAGTYDQDWLDHRHPGLPQDFDFGFWNGAPPDQQIDFPDLTAGCRLTTEGLTPGGEPMSVDLPPHRAYALMRFDDGVVLPNPMHVDLIELDTGDAHRPPLLRLVWRTAVLKSVGIRALEARFETDPQAPLFTLAPSPGYRAPRAEDWAEPTGDGAWHG
jgi:hypothetical protein